MKIVIVDNYDSFTYNLSHLIKELGASVDVVRNDQFQLPDLALSSHLALASQARPVSFSMSSDIMPVVSPYLACVSVIRPSASSSAASSST